MRSCGFGRSNEDRYHRAVNSEKYRQSGQDGVRKDLLVDLTCNNLQLWAGQRSRQSDWLRAGRSWDRNPVGARFSAPVHTGLRAHQASCTTGTGSFQGVKSGRGLTLTPHILLVPWSRKSRAISLLPLWALWLSQSLSGSTRV